VHFAGLGTTTGFPNGWKRPHRVAYQHSAPQFSGAPGNFLCFGKIQPDRDFDNHVLARSQCGERLSRMKLAGRSNHNQVDLVIRQAFLEVDACLVKSKRELEGLIFRKRNHPARTHTADFLKRLQVLSGNPAAHHADPNHS
jgi:hypothetical protein